MWVSTSVIRDIIYGAARFGANTDTICAKAGIDKALLDDATAKIGFEQAQKVWQVAVKESCEPLLGLKLGIETTTSVVGMVGHLMQTGRTLIEAFNHLCQYTTVFTEMFQYYTELTHEYFIIYLTPIPYWTEHYPETARQAADQAVAGSLNVCRLLTGKPVKPLWIELTASKGTHAADYERLLASPLRFLQTQNKIVFDAATANWPVLSYNQDLQQLLIHLADEALEKVQNSPSFTHLVQKTITGQFYNQLPTLEEVASYMNVSPRTLQRKLQTEGTGFQKVAEGHRKELAQRLIDTKKYTVNEVAYMVGYTDSSVFRRAYKRWTGKTPVH